jgi:glutamate dehydrogenase
MPDKRSKTISFEALLSHFDATLADEPAFRSFLKQAADQLGPDDLGAIDEKTLASNLDTYWRWAEAAAPRSVRLREMDLSDPASEPARLLLETTGADRPFLIDSLQGELAAQGIDLLAAVHPIVAGEDGPTSHIQFQLPQLLPEEADRLMKGVRETLDDVETAVSDFHSMRQRMRDEAQRLATMEIFEPAVRDEAYAFLSWLAEDHFVFLGSRSYRFRRDEAGAFLPEEPDMVEGSNLGLLRDERRNVLNAGEEPTVLTPEIGAFLNERTPVFVAKSNLQSRVHRRVLADYVGVKHYDSRGRVVGETRFAGLFTSEAYTKPTAEVPLIRRKVTNVMARSQAVPGSHNAKALRIILENHPRDELFQIDEDELLRTTVAILNLQSRPRPALFIRRDRFDRFVSALLYVPRESYNADMRRRIGEHVARAFDGEITVFYPRFGDDMLARVLFNIALKPGHPEPDLEKLKAEVANLARSWQDRFRAALDEDDKLTGQALQAAACFRNAFNAAYREAFSPTEAIADVREIAGLAATSRVRVRTYRGENDPDTLIRAKVYARGEPIALSACVPVMENLGFFVDFEFGYPVRPTDLPIGDAPDTYWIHDFNMRSGTGGEIDMDEIGDALEDAFVAVWTGRAENDAFNRLIPAIGADWHAAALFRTLARYRRQTGLDPSETVQVRALVTHTGITRKLLELFLVRFDPSREGSLEDRAARSEELSQEITAALRDVASLDEDRVLRRFRDLILATQRTNFFQRDADGRAKPVISLKIASREIDDLPAPRPFREIFLASPQVEGVHLRFGKVARGGLRWSDRRDDFRTEVLGLVKAQQVKNAVIVPVGSKGGFYPKQLPAGGSREDVFEAGRDAYKTYIRALLEITDNVKSGETTHPADTVIWDGEDPYLVVAADKGTATFSDTANAISEEMGHWLGDAFASGGSAGYDHKKMGITARGAWEAVKRHFREMGTDIQSEPFRAIGVGDMSGDVFGNGMLLSEKTRLIAAFNHLHIFIDPDPDPATSFEERQRLFNKDRSSWEDYKSELISEGGGVFKRSAKSIALTDAIRELTGLEGEETTPDALIAALIKAPCDLLWFGGIGTYIKCSTESHADVGDKTNDAIRADARDVQAKVIGEGANLGITQAGRIEFAMKGGRINTDAIDNSAGVDSSDHEVNIKILLKAAIENGALAAEDRNDLLADMTDQVASHVLAHNYSQTRALSLAAHEAEPDHGALERLMVELESRGVLDREVEGLPASAQMDARVDSGLWLTRPELSVLLAWSKIVLFDDILESAVPEDPFHAETLKQYFPDRLDAFEVAREGHRLKREIIATVLANRLLDRLGPGMAQRLAEASGAGPAALVTGFTLAEELLCTRSLEEEIVALDNEVAAEQQTLMRVELANGLFNLTARFANDFASAPVGETLERLSPAFATFREDPLLLATPFSLSRKEERIAAFTASGVPEDLAQRVMAMRPLIQGPLVITLAEETGRDIEASAKVFTAAGQALSLDRLRVVASETLAQMPFWDRVATRRFIADMMAQQVRLAKTAIAARGDEDDPVAAWLRDREADREALVAAIDAKAEDGWSYAKFAIAADDIRRFMEANGEGGE